MNPPPPPFVYDGRNNGYTTSQPQQLPLSHQFPQGVPWQQQLRSQWQHEININGHHSAQQHVPQNPPPQPGYQGYNGNVGTPPMYQNNQSNQPGGPRTGGVQGGSMSRNSFMPAGPAGSNNYNNNNNLQPAPPQPVELQEVHRQDAKRPEQNPDEHPKVMSPARKCVLYAVTAAQIALAFATVVILFITIPRIRHKEISDGHWVYTDPDERLSCSNFIDGASNDAGDVVYWANVTEWDMSVESTIDDGVWPLFAPAIVISFLLIVFILGMKLYSQLARGPAGPERDNTGGIQDANDPPHKSIVLTKRQLVLLLVYKFLLDKGYARFTSLDRAENLRIMCKRTWADSGLLIFQIVVAVLLVLFCLLNGCCLPCSRRCCECCRRRTRPRKLREELMFVLTGFALRRRPILSIVKTIAILAFFMLLAAAIIIHLAISFDFVMVLSFSFEVYFGVFNTALSVVDYVVSSGHLVAVT